jgi:hypothetical protein
MKITIGVLNCMVALGIFCYFVYDCMVVYHETHKLNMIIQSEIAVLKERSVIAQYLQTPYVKNPTEGLWNVIETCFLFWFISFSYLYISIIQLIRRPYYLM